MKWVVIGLCGLALAGCAGFLEQGEFTGQVNADGSVNISNTTRRATPYQIGECFEGERVIVRVEPQPLVQDIQALTDGIGNLIAAACGIPGP